MFSNLSKRSLQLARCASTRVNVARQATTKAGTAYEEALQFIELDKKERLNMLDRVEKELARVAKTATPAQVKALEALKFDLQVKSELNDSAVQKAYQLGKVDMSKPVFRYMRQRQFEKSPKSQLMERLTQMRVIPDILGPELNPTVQVTVKVPEGTVEPGVFLKPEQSMERPEIEVASFHTETRLYTIALIDPDSPDVENKTYQQRCHWLLTNVPLSATSSFVQGGDTVLDYIPPHPQKGTKYHRYTLIAYEQPAKLNMSIESRDHFDAKSLAFSYGLKATGATFFREEWNENVSSIYTQILHEHEPIYGKPPKLPRYIQRAMYY